MPSKTFIVTGASRGIGAAVAQWLLRNAHNVVLASRSSDALENVKQTYPGRVEYVAQDMTSPDAAQKLADLAVSAFGGIDGVVINHGTLQMQRFTNEPMDSIRDVFDVNVFSCVAMAKACLAQLRRSKGAIVWVSSGAASSAYASWASYGASKAAINAFSAVLAVEEPDITSVAITPGRVDTEMQALIRANGREAMDKTQYDGFVAAFRDGGLLKPEQPGHVMAKFVADPDHRLSGSFLKWNSPELAAYQ